MSAACKMYPDKLPESVRSNPKLSAEVQIYDALAHSMGIGWSVFYDVAWLGLVHSEGNQCDGQTDFIVAHPKKGVLLIEVKGGAIRFDGQRQQWISRDRFGEDHDIKNPFMQVRSSKYALLDKLKDTKNLRDNKWIELSYAVAFPAVARPQQAVQLHAPAEIIIGRDDLDRLPKRIEEILAFCHGESKRGFQHGAAIVDQLTRILATDIELTNPLSLLAAEEDRELIRLTESQFRMLSMLKRIRRAAIGGCAGSGKTFLAVEKAKQVASEGFKTLLTCYTQPLGNFLKELTRDIDNLTVCTLYELARVWQPDLPSAFSGDVDAEYTDALLNVMEGMELPPYDAIIVDEGQDFTADWWIALESCLREGKDSIFYVFHDTHQTLYRGGGTLPDSIVEFPLEENVRNTRSICDVLARHYKGDVKIWPRGPEGRTVETHEYHTQVELAKVLGKKLRDLVELEKFCNCELVVLTPRQLKTSCLPELKLPSGYRLVPYQPKPRSRDVLYASVDQFKGLERKVVIVVELDKELPSEPELRTALCYVAFSRPRHHLVLLGDNSTFSNILS